MNSRINQRYAAELAEESNITELASAGSLWQAIRHEVKLRADFEPIMSTFFHATVLNHETMEGALSFLLASKLDSPVVSSMAIREIIEEAYRTDPSIIHAAEIDIKATRNRDPACNSYSTPLLFYKGFHALQAYRIAHWLWGQERHSLAFYFQNQMSAIFGTDIHPAAHIGCGITGAPGACRTLIWVFAFGQAGLLYYLASTNTGWRIGVCFFRTNSAQSIL